jgi:hypothetical protein
MLPWPRSGKGGTGIQYPASQHENRPQAKFCEECADPFKRASPTTRSDADLKTEVEGLREALTEGPAQGAVWDGARRRRARNVTSIFYVQS